ncbi:MAG: PIG-L deacetylase family protein [Candidatus Aquicultor sp.]
MAVKLLKAVLILFSVVFVIGTVLYILGPSILRGRFVDQNIKTEPSRYKGLDAMPKDATILFVTAHPDDLEFMSGGALPKLIKNNGNKVYLAILTDGGKERYMPGFYSRAIVKTRHDDQLKIAKVEGLTKVFFINYPDGSLKYSQEAYTKIKQVADEIGATDIFTFEFGRRNGYYDPDHNAAGQVGTAVAIRDDAIKGLYYFRAADPNIVIDTSDTFKRKMEILFMFTEFTYKHRMMNAMHDAWDSATGKRIGVRYAEGYRVIDLGKLRETSNGQLPKQNP